MKEVNGYESPQVEVIEVEVEKGFAVSGNDDDYSDIRPGA